MAQHSGETRRVSVNTFTQLLAEDLGEDPEAIHEHAEEFDIEPPWDAEFEEIEDTGPQ